MANQLNFFQLVSEFLVSAVFIFLMITIICLVVKQIRQRLRTAAGGSIDPRPPPSLDTGLHSSQSGLDDESIQALGPVLKYSIEERSIASNVGETGINCVVCLCEYSHGDSCRKLSMCNHIFHQSCIDTWLKSNATCPVCRVSLITSSTIEGDEIV